MKNHKNDSRSRFTRMAVKQSLLQLMEKKPLNKITVAEICEGAEIYRGTFYNHFYDVYDVYEGIKNDLLDEVSKKLNQFNVYDLDKQFFKEIMTLIDRHRDVCRVLIDDKNTNFLSDIIDAIRQRFLKDWAEAFADISYTTLEYLFNFNISGSITIIGDWIKNDRKESLDDIAAIVGETNRVLVEACKARRFQNL